LPSGFKELLDFTVSTTKPTSGFYLEQVAPVDSGNFSEIDYYFTVTATQVPVVGPPVPEPGYWIPLAALGIVLAVLIRRRSAAVSN
jgi:hypothetical protein